MEEAMDRVLSVTFEVVAQDRTEEQFSIPPEVCEALGLSPGDDIALAIETSSGTYKGVKSLSSSCAVSGADIHEVVNTGRAITVVASRPEASRWPGA